MSYKQILVWNHSCIFNVRGNSMNCNKPWSAAWRKRNFPLCALILTASLALGQSSKISKDLASLPPKASVSVLVQYSSTPTSLDINAAKSLGATNGKALGLIKGYKWTMSPASVQSIISKDSNIKYVSPDRPVRGAMNFAVSAVGADIAHSLGYDGTGIGVAVIDSGVNGVWDLTQAGNSKTSRIILQPELRSFC